MGTIVVLLVIIGLIVMGLQRNHARQRDGTRSPAGSGTATDRDAERVVVDLEAARSRRAGGVTFADRPEFSRVAGTEKPHTLRDNGDAGTLRTVFTAANRAHRPHRT
ncbi:MAG TPA: hypothetical protein VJX10_14755 [Pseudonocardiaceae bacterium]|nr:hypothetical protein [Pseudonocardiaceae bacterium]